MTPEERLVQLSGLSSRTAIEHLIGLGSFGAITTGEQLQRASPLNIATAEEHLLAIQIGIQAPPVNIGRPIYPNMGIPGRNYEKAVLGRDGLYKSKRKRKRKYDYYEQGF